MNLTKNDYKIIEFLYNKGCLSKIYSLPLKSVAEGTNLSIYKIRDAMKMFLSLEIVVEGARDVRSKTFFLSDKGQNIAKENEIDAERVVQILNKRNETEGN